jgi:hypothetical protein
MVCWFIASTYSAPLSIGTGFNGPRALTFAPILILEEIPLNNLVSELLDICKTTVGAPVEIEFAMTFNPHRFGFLQVRTMVTPSGEIRIEPEELSGENILVATEHALGNGVIDTIQDIIYTKPETFDLKHTRAIVPELEHFNSRLLDEDATVFTNRSRQAGDTGSLVGHSH